MTSIQAQLNTQFSHAFTAAFGTDVALPAEPLVIPASNPKFGDYQCNAALPLAKPLKRKPRDIAQALLEHLNVEQWCEVPTIAGPGFINLTLKTDYVAEQLNQRLGDERLGVDRAKSPQRVIVDFSSPNIAKEMHVGHLRSTIIGDSIARILEFQGHDVLRLNHVGDWGTQFGMLICYLREAYPQALTTSDALDLGDLVAFYKKAKQRFDADEDFKTAAREEVVRLQAGAADSRRAWQLLCDQSRREFQTIYDRLDIKLQERGESFYNPLLPGVIETLATANLLEEDGGAQCVFLDGFKNKAGKPLPLIIQKSDGGYNYATTDLAALQYRIGKDESDRIIYVTDSGQANHFTQVFQVARKAGILSNRTQVVHVPFGLVQGEDGKKLKTRSGETVKLKDLLNEAVGQAYQDLEQRLDGEERTETEEFIRHVAQVVGLSAVKYADLSQNRTSNYIFSYAKMLNLKGNTSPYMLYSYARMRSILRKGRQAAEPAPEPISKPVVETAIASPTTDVAALQPEAIPMLTTLLLLTRLGNVANEVLDIFGRSDALSPGIAAIRQLQRGGWPWTGLSWTAAIAIAGFVTGDFTWRVYGLVHTVPLLPSAMCLVGVFASGQFFWRFVLFAQGRQQLATKLTATRNMILGPPQPSTPPAISISDDQPAPVVPADLVDIHLTEPEEIALAKHILQLSEVLQEVEQDLLPNRLCEYLFELSQKCNKFFEECPVLKSEEPARSSRLALCDLTSQTIRLGLSLLGIPVLERL